MLILSRRLGESIQIEDVTITITRISGDRVKLGIVAPKEVDIARSELLDRFPKKGKEE